ncbi:(+)-neomenthol dehydrogenase [Capsicum annuum]|nr:(+)-neomenthol dehydrogenase [Capsicum annuum]KAF3684436.1 (+)-neomenthol dehydrogenase [Capsicum annuum]
MAEKTTNTRYAVVTGGNKGIGYETCKELVSKGVVVVLTSRYEKKGIEAIERLKKESNTTNNDKILLNQLDVLDPTSISSLVDFIKSKFERLDILYPKKGAYDGTYNTTYEVLKTTLFGSMTPKETKKKGVKSRLQDKSPEHIGLVEEYLVFQINQSPHRLGVRDRLQLQWSLQPH